MKTKQALAYLRDFIREMIQRNGRTGIEFGHCENIINHEHWTVLWLNGDRQRCIGYIRVRYTGNDEHEVETKQFDTPRPHTSLAPVARCAFTAVTLEKAVAIFNRGPVHGNN